jgi:hypothetical protein
LQKRLAGGLSWPQWGHAANWGAPQLLQNLAPAGFSARHDGQPIPSLHVS